MTGHDHGEEDTMRKSFLALKRQLTDVKLDALLREPEPACDINDLDAIVAEVLAGVEGRRQARSASSQHHRAPSGAPGARERDLSGAPGQPGSA
ncbi:hypothetical protein [Nocardia sp. NPDC127526]|uniref:hypothetical protein n=1 Tax=Nocardia sp. NPDC127526 TaxID=3345393 RepID=UPI0036403C85